jgi:uncharacterized protein
MNRRTFLTHSVATSAAVGAGVVFGQDAAPTRTADSAAPVAGTEPKRRPPLDLATVKEFVGAGHGNLPRVKEMLAGEPRLVLASYDWGTGDFETALGGAAHTGRREIALHLLESGARIDAFCAAMLGETETVTALMRFSPATAATRGPHGYTLLYHAGYSGKIPIGEAIIDRLGDRALDRNQALQTATQSGHTEFVAWLLQHGVDNVNTKNFAGKTPLDLALEKGHDEIAKLLRARGGLTKS